MIEVCHVIFNRKIALGLIEITSIFIFLKVFPSNIQLFGNLKRNLFGIDLDLFFWKLVNSK